MTTQKAKSKMGVAFLVLGTAILLLTLHPDVWGFASLFLRAGQPTLWVWPVGLYGFVVASMTWGGVQVARARRAS